MWGRKQGNKEHTVMPKAALWCIVKCICKEQLSTQPQILMNTAATSLNASSELHVKLHLISIIPV
jgi:hypothetical protein